MRSATLCLLSFVTVITAQVPLYIPGFDTQPIIAAPAGVDSQGHTTWLLMPAPQTDDQGGFSGTATLVEGPDYASVGIIDPEGPVTLEVSCTITGEEADCSSPSQPGIFSEPVSFITVQLAAATAAPSGPQPGAGSPAATSKAGTTASASKPATSQTSSPNSARMTIPGMIGALGSTVLVFFSLL